MKVERGTLIWAFQAHFFFGLCNFLIGYSNSIDANPWAVVGVLWFTSGVVGLAPAAHFYQARGGLFFSQLSQDLLEDPSCKPPAISTFVKFVTIAGGLCVGFSQLLMKTAFGILPAEMGPLTAVISSDTLVVSTFCHFVYQELLSYRQAACIVSIVVGLCVMALGSGGSSGPDGASGLQQAEAYLYALFGMFLFASTVLGMRIGFMAGLAAWSGFVVRMITVLGCGVISFAYAVWSDGVPQVPLLAWSAPVVAGLCQAAGVFCVNKALQYPNTGIANAIFASNSVMVLVLNTAVTRLLPSLWSLVGMAIVVASVAGISLLQDAGDGDDLPVGLRSPAPPGSPLMPGSPFSRQGSMSPYNLQCDHLATSPSCGNAWARSRASSFGDTPKIGLKSPGL